MEQGESLATSSYALGQRQVIAVRRVTVNDGRKTPGVDGELWDTPHKKLQGVISLTARGYRPMPMRRIYIPKAMGSSDR